MKVDEQKVLNSGVKLFQRSDTVLVTDRLDNLRSGHVLACSDAQNVQWSTKMCSDERLFFLRWKI